MSTAFEAVMPLTPHEANALRIIQECLDQDGHPPTLQTLAGEMDMRSKSAAFRIVSRLVEKGWLRRLPGRRYNIQILRRLPPPAELGAMDVRTVAEIAVDAIGALRAVADRQDVARSLAIRLQAALTGNQGARRNA